MPPTDRANLPQQRALKLRIDKQDQPIVGWERDAAYLRLSPGEIAIGPVFEPHICLIAPAQPAAKHPALQLDGGVFRLLGGDLPLTLHALQHAERAVISIGRAFQRIAVVRLGQHADEQRRFGQI